MGEENNLQATAIDSSALVGELNTSAEITAVLQEIQGAMILAKKFPRNFNEAWDGLTSVCQRKTFAKKATYSYPRGGKAITGPSVKLARAAAQCWGNIRTGITILKNDEDSIKISGWAWDIEKNSKTSYDEEVKKLIQRKQENGTTQWVKPDERDLRELIFNRGARLVRNAIFHIIPDDLIEDAIAVCRQTLSKNIKDPKGEAKKLILEFKKLGVTFEMMSRYVGTDEWTADEIITLHEVLNAIKDGEARIRDYFKIMVNKEDIATGALSEDDMKPSDDAHQGYDDPTKESPPEPKKGAKSSQTEAE